jgi:hypothetical protein|tara:strand:+ start:750 stop:905 length:156 start_codon:yes stop_codon:yes gene_type:complete
MFSITDMIESGKVCFWFRMSIGRTSPMRARRVLLFLDQIKREKGVWWMPWQ